MRYDERRLEERILFAMELALEERDLEVSELLGRSLETVATRFGGPGRVELRQSSEAMIAAFDALAALRQSVRCSET